MSCTDEEQAALEQLALSDFEMWVSSALTYFIPLVFIYKPRNNKKTRRLSNVFREYKNR